jgi:hypothetical protein
MLFKVYTFSALGLNQEGSFYSHLQAFNFALEIESSDYLTYIVERQWCTTNNILINKNYYVKNKSIYNTDDMDIPIFTYLIEYSKYNIYRNYVQAIFKNILNIYNYMNIRCPYTDEYNYSYTFKELQNLERTMLKDKNVKHFYQEARYYFNSTTDIIKMYNLPAADYMHKIIRLEPVDLIETLKLTQKEVKNYLLKYSYGASLIDMYPL